MWQEHKIRLPMSGFCISHESRARWSPIELDGTHPVSTFSVFEGRELCGFVVMAKSST